MVTFCQVDISHSSLLIIWKCAGTPFLEPQMLHTNSALWTRLWVSFRNYAKFSKGGCYLKVMDTKSTKHFKHLCCFVLFIVFSMFACSSWIWQWQPQPCGVLRPRRYHPAYCQCRLFPSLQCLFPCSKIWWQIDSSISHKHINITVTFMFMVLIYFSVSVECFVHRA